MDFPISLPSSTIQGRVSHNNRNQQFIKIMKRKRRHSFRPYFRTKKRNHSCDSLNMFSLTTNLQFQCSRDIQKVIIKLEKLQEENQKLQNQLENINTKIDNVSASSSVISQNSQTDSNFFVAVVPEDRDNFSNEIQIIPTTDTSFVDNDECQNHSTNEIVEPNWIVEKNKCNKLIEKAQNQLPYFLSFYLPEIYNSAELVSPAYFPEADQKHQEINAIINYFWKNQSTQDFYAKAIEKELQIQRYKVTRKMYHLLKTIDCCIMGKDGKVYDCRNDRVQAMMLRNDEETYTEWSIPNELIYDDYVVGAKKDGTNNKTFIYKLDLPALSEKLIYTKRK